LGGKGVGAHGTLRFAAPSSFAQLHIMPLLPEFQTLFPDLTLDLRLSDTSIDAIEGSFDLALRSAPRFVDAFLPNFEARSPLWGSQISVEISSAMPSIR
jgi:DNA-binding transcriptional LysR family regulator